MRALFRVILRSCERPKGSAKSMQADGRCDMTFPCDPFFWSWGLLRPNGSVTIRGVSTKLKVNSGRTSPTVNFQQEDIAEKSGNDPSMVSR